MKDRYVIITAARDEEAFIRFTLDSVVHQTILPLEWVIVDDGSTDKTAEIISERSSCCPWIRLLQLPNRGQRRLGAGVVQSFNHGLAAVQHRDYDFISKLDADQSLPPHYFQFLLEQFDGNPCLGVASGSTYLQTGGRLVWERNYERRSRGSMKVYRRKCFEAIGGLVPQLGWDVIDDYKAQAKGWETRSFKELVVIHHRPMGTSGGGLIAGKIRFGEVQYLLNYHPVFALGSGAYRMMERPYLVAGLAIWYGYLRPFFQKKGRTVQGDLKDFIRAQQWERVKSAVRCALTLKGLFRNRNSRA